MAIVRVSSGNLARKPEGGPPAKAAKHAAKKHAAKKHAAKHALEHAAKHAAKHATKHAAKHAAKAANHAAKHAAKAAHPTVEAEQTRPCGFPYLVWNSGDEDETELTRAFHHLQRAGAVISLLEGDSGGDLRSLLENGIDLYRGARLRGHAKVSARCASGLLRAAEHLGMAGLYAARRKHQVDVPAPSPAEIEHHLQSIRPRLKGLGASAGAKCLAAMAEELLRQAEASMDDLHLAYELTMAADGICSALEAGLP